MSERHRRKREVPLTTGPEANAPRVVLPLMNTVNTKWSPKGHKKSIPEKLNLYCTEM